MNQPFQQPLGARRWRDVWARQVRWARLRRATFALYFAPEVLTSSLFTLGAAAFAAPELGLDVAGAVALAALAWYGVEAALTRAAGSLSWSSAPAWIARDFLLPWFMDRGLGTAISSL